MELIERTSNPWGQDVLVRISWDLFYIALAAGALFCIVHLLLRPRWLKREAAAAKAPAGFVVGRRRRARRGLRAGRPPRPHRARCSTA